MKRCPNCNQIFSDENMFCLNDGTPLLDVSNPSQVPTVSLIPKSPPTSFVPRQTANTSVTFAIPGWLYAVLGAMVVIIIALIIALGAMFFIARAPAEKETAKTEPTTKPSEPVSNANQQNAENKTSGKPTNKSASTVISTLRPQPSINPNLNPAGR